MNALLPFAITGILGTLTNLALFYVWVDISGGSPMWAAICGHIIAATQNYVLNHYWTFKGKAASAHVSIRGWLLFLASSLAGLLVNLLVLQLALPLLSWPVLAQALGIAAGFLVNFIAAKLLVFNR